MSAAGTRLVVLSKPPLRGRCKQRLARDVGQGAAARLARAFLRDVWTSLSSLVSRRPDLDLVLAQASEGRDYPLLLPRPSVLRQPQGDLGRRMATLAAGGLVQRERALLLGTDSIGIPDAHVLEAVDATAESDVVIGPHEDGGFWCLGVRSGHPALYGNTWLDGLDWSVDETRAQVQDRARRLGMKVTYVAPWFDVDHGRDLERLRAVLWADDDAAPATRRAIEEHDAARGAEPLSIVIPTLDEGDELLACLDALATQPGPIEVVVADGGSRDASPERAYARGVTVVQTERGRGAQLAAGAAMATGEILLFLHVDARLPARGTDLVRETLDGDETSAPEAGAFVTRTVADPTFRNPWGPLLRLSDLRSRTTRHPYGDQALFVSREAYDAVGGFRPLPIMEDYDLARRLAARTPIARVREPVLVSGRRLQRTPLRTLALFRLIPPLFRLGVSPDVLARMYRR